MNEYYLLTYLAVNTNISEITACSRLLVRAGNKGGDREAQHHVEDS